jgi:hypothetical protein
VLVLTGAAFAFDSLRDHVLTSIVALFPIVAAGRFPACIEDPPRISVPYRSAARRFGMPLQQAAARCNVRVTPRRIA